MSANDNPFASGQGGGYGAQNVEFSGARRSRRRCRAVRPPAAAR
jgi:hypothetical protein